ncbi:Lar family restriction alleviation protein [Parendozoicomonas sp. Alg238-R29]|uniref:Lar family restriction alleviation protein n=1 Tax=Parendozoicomonas sp. Alg238-R29 TaxID=2993446 RepID=UPI00248D9624|nr:Lar family restriction alleviation protein [Parendozoicomonas sp. Alg238-R29]
MSTTTVTQLEPCPFCGGTQGSVHHQVFSHRVICKTCNACGPRCRTQEQALLQWEHQSRELRLEKTIENRLLLEHLSNFGDLPPPVFPAQRENSLPFRRLNS